jgi:tetratricopeptide (TPR) repeat protein
MATIDYLNFDVCFEPFRKKYRAKVIGAPVGEGEKVEFAYPFSAQEQKRYREAIFRLERNNVGNGVSKWETTKAFGKRLFDTIFQGEVFASYRSSLETAKARNVGLRLRLRLNETPDLAAIPWEYLYNEKLDRFLAISTRTPVVRYFELPESVSSFIVEPPLNILVVISRPVDQLLLEVEQEWSHLTEAFHKLRRKGLVRIDRLEEASLEALQRKLCERPYHIFHFIGHGKFDERTNAGSLIFEDEDKLGHGKSGEQLGALLRDHSSLRLAVLNACYGARPSQSNAFAGCAQRLVQHGMPAVIAMQCPVQDTSAIIFANTFYDFLMEGYPVDGALSEARKAIFIRDKEAEWAAPVLFMRSPHGRIFDLQRERAIISPAPSPPPRRPARFALAGTFVIFFIWWLWTHVLNPPIPEQKHLLVLPLLNVSHDSLDQAFCDGLMETLTSRLTQLEQYSQRTLWVVPATEVRESRIKSVHEAKRKFGVNLVVSGSVQRNQNEAQLTINLTDAAKLRQTQAFEIAEPSKNISDLQDKAVLKLAKILQVDLQPRARQVMIAGGTAVPNANAFYLQGRGYLAQYRQQAPNLEMAQTLFQRALEHDSLYALAYAGLGEAFWKKYETTSKARWIVEAEQNCRRALELNMLIMPARLSLAQIYNGTGRYEQALKEVEKAFVLDSVNAEAYRLKAFIYENLGDLPEAEKTYKQAIALRPDYWDGYNNLGVFYFQHGRYHEAVTQFQQVVALTPDNVKGYNNLGALYHYLARYDEARAAYNRSLLIEPSYEAYNNLATIDFIEAKYYESARWYWQALQIDSTDYQVWGNLASAYYWMPHAKAPARQHYQHAARLAEEKKAINPRDAVVLADLAEYYAQLEEGPKAHAHILSALKQGADNVNVMATAGLVYETLGKRETALSWLKKALKNGYTPSEIAHQPAFRKLREDKGFQKILQ